MNPALETGESLGETQLSILKSQYSEIGIMFRTVWDFYLKFYVAFMALNFTALGLVIQYMDRRHRWPLVVSFGIQNILSAMTALGVGAYSRHAAKQQKSIIDACLMSDGEHDLDSIKYQTPVPSQLASWGSSANALSQLLFIACWVASLYVGEIKTH